MSIQLQPSTFCILHSSFSISVVRGAKPRWWQWFTILSLDATAVSLVWQQIFARAARAQVGFAEMSVLGSSVWLAYSADRWIEAWRLKPENFLTQRHRFAARWRWELLAVWSVVFIADVTISFVSLPEREWTAGAMLLVAVAIYLLSHQFWHRESPWRLPKELCVAALITAGALVFVVPQPLALSNVLVAPAGHFFALCFINCGLISFWEQEVDQKHGQVSLALISNPRANRLARMAPWLLAVESGVAGIFFNGEVQSIFICLAVSSAALGVVDLAEPRMGRQLARVLADVVLLTPILTLVVGR